MSMEVKMWLKSCACMAKNEVDGCVIMNDTLEEEYDRFRVDLKDKFYLPENELLLLWYTNTQCSTCTVVEKHGDNYAELTYEEVDTFHVWLTEKRSKKMQNLPQRLTVVRKDNNYCIKAKY